LFCLHGAYVLTNGFTGEYDILITETCELEEPFMLSLVNGVVALPITLRLTSESIYFLSISFNKKSCSVFLSGNESI